MRFRIDSQGFIEKVGDDEMPKPASLHKPDKTKSVKQSGIAKNAETPSKVTPPQERQVAPVYNEKVFNSKHPLYKAIDGGYANLVKLLVNTVPERLHIRAHDGMTPLHYAVIKARIEIIRFLVLRGASQVSVNERGETPLQLAKVLGSPPKLIEAFYPPSQPPRPAPQPAPRTSISEEVNWSGLANGPVSTLQYKI